MTEVSNQQQRGGFVPTLLTAGAAAGGYFAADKANFGYKPEVQSWEEAVAKVNGKDEFVTKQIEKADGDAKKAWEALKVNAEKASKANGAIKELVADGAEDYSDELGKYLKAVDEEAAAKKALKAGETIDAKFAENINNAKTELKNKVKLKDGKSFEDDFLRAVTERKNLFADKGDDVANQLKHIKIANKWANACIFAAVGLITGLGLNALLNKNKQ